MGRRTYKGEVSLYNDKGKIRLRWRLNGKRYSLTNMIGDSIFNKSLPSQDKCVKKIFV
jgi:hypothetical protein